MIAQTFSHFRILEKLGAGGMGEVYLAEDTTLRRRVALKVLPAELMAEEESLRRFKQEARAASALNHPNILTVHEVGEANGIHFIATEYVAGETLRQRVRTSGSLPPGEALAIATQIASALAAAHDAGIVHRDIKPENVMLRPDGLVKVVDFGLAKERAAPGASDIDVSTVELAHTRTGAILGTAQYMSPEQARGLPVDGRTDIWSLGCLLYEMLTGRAPFSGASLTDILVAILERDPPPIDPGGSSSVRMELERIVEKALRKNADHRYQTAKELLDELQRLGRPVEGGSAAAGAGAMRGSAAPSGETVLRPQAGGRKLTRGKLLSAAIAIVLLSAALAGIWRWRQGSAPAAEIRSLAVLPLRPLDSSDSHLGLGIADAVIRRISQTGKLIVRPTSAVRRYVNQDVDALTAARQLRADAVLEGSVQRTADRLRVSVNLLRTSDDASLWTDSFDMRMTDIFAIQDSVAQQVASRLQLHLDPGQRARLIKRATSNAVAYEYYLRGMYSFDQRGFGLAGKPNIDSTIDLYRKAIEADPSYALAHAQLASAYIWKALFVVPAEQSTWAALGREEINRAQSLDPNLPETHVARQRLLNSAHGGFQIEQAARELLRAQQIDPNTGHTDLADIYFHLGLEELAERRVERAFEVDPTSEFLKTLVVNTYFNAHRFDDYLAAEKRFHPGETTHPWYFLGKGRLEEAQQSMDRLAASQPDAFLLPQTKAMLFALQGNSAAAEAQIPAILRALDRRIPSYHHHTFFVACIYAVLGRDQEAVKWLRETAATGFPAYTVFKRDQYLKRIARSPAYVQFMSEMKARHDRYRQLFGS